MTTALPRSVALLGPDVVLLALETLGTGTAASSNAVLVVEHEGVIAAPRLEAALARFLPLCPWLGGRLRRPRPWGRLAWRVPRGGPTIVPVRTETLPADTLTALVDRELAARIDPYREPPLRVTLAQASGSTRLVLTWSHPLMDPHGAEHLLRLLADIDDREDGTPPWATPPLVVAPPDTRSFRERGALATRGAARLKGLAPVPPVSLAARAGSVTRADRAPRHRRFRFTAAPTAATDRLRSGMPWRLAVVATAMAAQFAKRGLSIHVPFLVPVSVERRARGEHGPVLGNYLGFHFARFAPPTAAANADDVARLARELRDQLAAAVRADDLETTWAGMSFARYRPLRGMFRELPWTAHGDFCSFHFADTGAMLADRTHLFGARIRGGYHVASVPARPGAGVFFTRAGDVENVVVSFTEGVLDDADAAEIAGVVQREMGWTPLTA